MSAGTSSSVSLNPAGNSVGKGGVPSPLLGQVHDLLSGSEEIFAAWSDLMDGKSGEIIPAIVKVNKEKSQ